MLASVLVARALGPSAVGAIGFSLGLAGLVMAALLPGFGLAHLKRVAEGQDIGRCVGTMLAIQSALTLAVLIVAAAVWPIWGPSGDSGAVFAAILAAQLAGALAEAMLRVFVGREWPVPYAGLLLGGRILRLLLTVLIIVSVPSVVWVAVTFLAENVAVGTAALVVLVRHQNVRVRRPTRASLVSYWTYARPLLVTTPLGIVLDSADRYVVGRFAGLTVSGYYHVARALWEVIGSLLAAPWTFLFTQLSAIYAARTEESGRRGRAFFAEAMDKVLFVATPLALLFWAFAEPLIAALYGPSFVPAAPAVRILVLASIAMTIVDPYTLVVMALDAAHRFIAVNVLRLAVYLVLLGVLVAVPSYDSRVVIDGAAGAALTRLLLVLFPAWVYWRWTRELAGIPFYRRAWTYVIGFLMMAIFVSAVQALTETVVARMVAAALALAGYVLVLYVVHPDTPQNIRYVRSLFSPSQFLAFLASRAG
jgi:O-antigen/teichoic acid export membrane protein